MKNTLQYQYPRARLSTQAFCESYRLTTQRRLLVAAVVALMGQTGYAEDGATTPGGQASDQTLAPIMVKAKRSCKTVCRSDSDYTRQFPASSASISAQDAQQTINVVNAEDSLKYLPSLTVRKRYIGDTQAPLATRTTGVNGSARSLIYADGVLLSSLINNNNGNGSPQWYMVAPEEIARVDVLYGPYSAAYAGNSYGGVVQITTQMPQQFTASASVRGATQGYRLYDSHDRYGSGQYNLAIGDKVGDFAWLLSAEHLESSSQPISFATLSQSTTAAMAAMPVVSGAIAAQNRTGGPIQVIGAGNITHSVQDNVKLKLAYDISPTLDARYMIGYWQNNASAYARSYLRDSSGAPYYGGSGSVNLGGYAYSASSIAGQFSSNEVEQAHLMQSLSLQSHDAGLLNWQFIASHLQNLNETTRQSTGLYPAAQDGGAGRITDASGTGWTTLDLKGDLQPMDGSLGHHTLSGGLHGDWYKLVSPTYNSPDWRAGSTGSLYSRAQGGTQTQALWLQDVWQLAPQLKATLGARYERWRADDGYNLATTSSGASYAVNQPTLTTSAVSPKASLAWTANALWTVTGSVGKAVRFPTVGELYQNVQTGSTYSQPNPNLKPERVVSDEVAFERKDASSQLRLSLFEERVANALISQTSIIPGYASPVSFTQNVDRTRQRGVELAGQMDDVLLRGLQLSGSVTYVHARILRNSGYVATLPGAISEGQVTPYIPDWRATLVATYQPDRQWAFTLAGRYSGTQYATVDNTDINASTYTGFQRYFVMDARVSYQLDQHWSAALGVDNLNNRRYFLYHPFPQRTVMGELKYRY